MLISVKLGQSEKLYSYNAPTTVKVGDEVVVPVGYGEHTGKVVAAGAGAAALLMHSGWTGAISSIISVKPLAVTVEASSRAQLARKLRDLAEDIEDEIRLKEIRL